MKPNEADGILWKINYTAMVNQLYYEKLAKRWWNVEMFAKCASAVSMIGGLVLGYFVQDAHRVAVLATTLGAGAALLLLLFPTGRFRGENMAFRQRWTEIRGRCQSLYIQLRRSASNRKIDDAIADELKELNDLKSKIDRDESECDERLINWCQGEINKRTYAVSEGTYKEVMESIAAH